MKLPSKDDPQGNLEGALPLSIVITALYKSKVDIQHLGNDKIQLTKNNVVRVVVLKDGIVYGLMVRDLIRVFELNLKDLYGKNMLH